ncbi:hypothetical protein Ssi03_61590 [Sphaerisporangium siamense]|uniref:YcaO domain-containing protein n=1 Tax=Sphaerisporangium siamense TaxID=795645 RepID=A0A7W7GAK3_9ACTN|nr:hypothetical protein [Sphaerisporangium siamense]MBB4702472.1 hypothetical protein [Sphaerisporangium siamense]GII88169.1 hypothetical protein Ssi03_61590 [Sphaerisporangium siamense]
MAPIPDSPRSAISASRPPVRSGDVHAARGRDVRDDTEVTKSAELAESMAGTGIAESTEGTAEVLGGEVHLAYARRAASGVVAVAAGFTPRGARARAETRATALDALYAIPGSLSGPDDDVRELGLADFMPEPPADIEARVAGIGLLSGDSYALPAGIVWLGDRDGRVEPTTVGVPDDGEDGAIADLLAHDMVTRWWASPRTPLLRVSEHLPRLIPEGAAAAASLLGLRVSAFLLPGPDFQIAVAGVSGDGATIAAAAARTARAAVGEAFLRAIAARAQPWSTLPVADSLRRLTVWHRESDYLAYLEWSALEVDPTAVEAMGVGAASPSWAEIATRRFGHEPVLVTAFGHAVKVVCPGAACYRTAPPGTPLPCPVP